MWPAFARTVVARALSDISSALSAWSNIFSVAYSALQAIRNPARLREIWGPTQTNSAAKAK